MKRFILAAIAVLAMTGCKTQPPAEVQPLCDVMFATVAGAAQGLSQALGCANVGAIAKDLSAPLLKLNLCPKEGETQQGVFGDMVCAQVTTFVVGMGVNSLPKAWDCTGGAVAENLAKVVGDTCKKAVKF